VSQRLVADGPARWLDVALPSVAENLALDEALLAEAHDGLFAGVVVRTWMAREPAVVLGPPVKRKGWRSCGDRAAGSRS